MPLPKRSTAFDFLSSAATTGLDPKLVGTWTAQGRTYEIRADGSYFVREALAYALSPDGQRLDWGPMVFDRLSGDAAGVAGHWITPAQDEDVLMRADGTYVWHIANSFPDALGEWAVATGKIESAELRATISTSGSDISFDAVFGGTSTGSYALTNADQTLTVELGGVSVIYTRA